MIRKQKIERIIERISFFGWGAAFGLEIGLLIIELTMRGWI